MRKTAPSPPIQQLKLTFPSATLTLPTYPTPAQNNNSGGFQDRGDWNYRFQQASSIWGRQCRIYHGDRRCAQSPCLSWRHPHDRRPARNHRHGPASRRLVRGILTRRAPNLEHGPDGVAVQYSDHKSGAQPARIARLSALAAPSWVNWFRGFPISASRRREAEALLTPATAADCPTIVRPETVPLPLARSCGIIMAEVLRQPRFPGIGTMA